MTIPTTEPSDALSIFDPTPSTSTELAIITAPRSFKKPLIIGASVVMVAAITLVFLSVGISGSSVTPPVHSISATAAPAPLTTKIAVAKSAELGTLIAIGADHFTVPQSDELTAAQALRVRVG